MNPSSSVPSPAVDASAAELARDGSGPAVSAERCHGEAGFTLPEILIALIILGTAVVALVTGLATSIATSDLHRKQAVVSAMVRNEAEAIKAAVQQACASATTPTPTYTVTYTPPLTNMSAYNPPQIVSNTAGTPFGSCPTSAASVVSLTITASSKDGRASQPLTIEIINP